MSSINKNAKDQFSTRPTISMRSVKNSDNSFQVEMVITGLLNEQQADAALAHLERVLCASEVSTN